MDDRGGGGFPQRKREQQAVVVTQVRRNIIWGERGGYVVHNARIVLLTNARKFLKCILCFKTLYT